jgi:hypothetical protein
MNEFVYHIGYFLEWTFGIFEALGNAYNIFFTLFFIGAVVWWMLKMKQLFKESEEKGELI